MDDGQRFETSNLHNRGILLFTVNKNTAQLRGYREADLRLETSRFSHDAVEYLFSCNCL